MKKIICLALVLCAVVVLTGCQQQQETFPNQPRQDAEQQQPAQQTVTDAPVQQINFDDGSYDPASEESGEGEPVDAGITPPPTMRGEYAGATPVRIDPVDKPTPTPLPTLTFSYANYTAANLHLTFEGPAGWLPDDSAADTYILADQNMAMDYPARAILRTVNVGKDYTQKELINEVKAQAESLRTAFGLKTLELSNTATRALIEEGGVYLAYKGTMDNDEETGVAGRIIVNTVNRTLYILNVSYPRALADTYAEGVYNKIRRSLKIIN